MSVCEGCIVASEKLHFIEGHPAAYKGIICGVTGKAYAHGYSYLKPTRRKGTPPPFPDTCPYAPILKLLLEAEEVLPRIDITPVTNSYYDKGMVDTYPLRTLEIKFWIRRKP